MENKHGVIKFSFFPPPDMKFILQGFSKREFEYKKQPSPNWHLKILGISNTCDVKDSEKAFSNAGCLHSPKKFSSS